MEIFDDRRFKWVLLIIGVAWLALEVRAKNIAWITLSGLMVAMLVGDLLIKKEP